MCISPVCAFGYVHCNNRVKKFPLKGLIKYAFFSLLVYVLIQTECLSTYRKYWGEKSIHGAQKTTPHDSDTPDLYWNISTTIVRNTIHGTIGPSEWVLWAFIFFLQLKLHSIWRICTQINPQTLWYPDFSYLLHLHCTHFIVCQYIQVDALSTITIGYCGVILWHCSVGSMCITLVTLQQCW